MERWNRAFLLETCCGNTKLTSEQFLTTTAQIERIPNLRPLTPLASNNVIIWNP